jgi:hypothetical protein
MSDERDAADQARRVRNGHQLHSRWSLTDAAAGGVTHTIGRDQTIIGESSKITPIANEHRDNVKILSSNTIGRGEGNLS